MGRKQASAKRKRRNLGSSSDQQAKQSTSYTTEQLLDKVEEYVDTFQYDLAEKFCARAREQAPDNVRALEISGVLMLELGNLEEAKTMFNKAMELCPDSGHSKYMYMGQIHTGAEAVQYFLKGIELMKKLMVDMAAQAEAMAASPAPDSITPLDVSTAYCSVAEIYLTDECFEEDADTRCKQCLDQAVDVCSDNPETHHLYASYWLSKAQPEKALEEMQKGLALWLPQWKAASEADKDGGETGALSDDVTLCPLSYPSRINATKLLIELQQYETASDVLELLLDEEDAVVETWYLLGWVNHMQGEDYKNNARYYLGKAQKVAKKTRCEDKDLLKHVNKLLEELGGPVGDDENVEENGDMEIHSDSEEEETNQNGHEHMDQ